MRHVVLVASLVGCAAAAQPLFADAGTTSTGAPYVLIGSRTPVWDVYRKLELTGAGSPAPVLMTVTDAGTVRVENLVAGCGGADCVFNGVMFFGLGPATTSPGAAMVELVRYSPSGPMTAVDLRVGFIELDAPDGGSGPAAFVAAHAGDLGLMDPYAGNWGADGVTMHGQVSNEGPTWAFSLQQVTQIAGGSALVEVGRADQSARTSSSAPAVQVPSHQSLRLEWSLATTAGTTVMTLRVGDMTVSWILDDGAALDGRFDAGNPDGVAYTGGKLRVDRLVPVLFLGNALFSATLPLPAMELELAFPARKLALTAQTVAEKGQLTPASVALTDVDGGRFSSAAQVVIETTDGFTTVLALDAGAADFSFAWSALGPQRLSARLLEDPSLFDSVAVSVGDAGVADAGVLDAGVVDAGVVDAGVVDAGVVDAGVVQPGSQLKVGCGCLQTGELLGWLGAAWLLRRRPRTSSRSARRRFAL